MRLVVCKELGPLEDIVIEERDDLIPGPGQVVLDVKAAGVNFVDGLIAQGKYQMKPPAPFTPGGEVAGVVAAVGEGVTEVAVGDRGIAMTGFNGFASQVALPARSLLPMPAGVGFGVAAALI